MEMEGKGKPEDTSRLFLQAWNEATNDFEKYIAAYYVARHQDNVRDKLKWLETALQFALKVHNESAISAFPNLYSNIAKCYEEMGDVDNAKKNFELANSFTGDPSDEGPFYHGTKADLQVGDLLTPGGRHWQLGATMKSKRACSAARPRLAGTSFSWRPARRSLMRNSLPGASPGTWCPAATCSSPAFTPW